MLRKGCVWPGARRLYRRQLCGGGGWRPRRAAAECSNCVFELGQENRVFEGVGDVDFPWKEEVIDSFADVRDGFAKGTVDRAELQYFVLAVRVPDEISKNGVRSWGGIVNEDDGGGRDVEDLRDGFAGLAEELGIRVHVTVEMIWMRFAKLVAFVPNGTRERPQRTWNSEWKSNK